MSSNSNYCYSSPYFVIDHDLQLIIEVLRGSYDLRKLSALRRIEMNHPKYNKGYDILTDLRSASLDINAQDILKYNFQMESITFEFQKNKMAILTDSPKETALSFMLLNKIKRDEYSGGVFSTEEGATNWLGYNQPAHREKITEFIFNLKNLSTEELQSF